MPTCYMIIRDGSFKTYILMDSELELLLSLLTILHLQMLNVNAIQY